MRVTASERECEVYGLKAEWFSVTQFSTGQRLCEHNRHRQNKTELPCTYAVLSFKFSKNVEHKFVRFCVYRLCHCLVLELCTLHLRCQQLKR